MCKSKPYPVKRILAATTNKNKLKELQTVAKEFSIEIIAPSELKLNSAIPVVEETGKTYIENAVLKAKAFATWANLPALGDDSGLEVAALDRRPGVYSARYGGEGLSDAERCHKLLEELKASGSPDRTAYFCCQLVLFYPNGAMLSADSSLKGKILDNFQGNKGFGYDPIVLIEKLGKTLAEVEFEVTCSQGFRSEAANKLFSELLALEKY